MDLTGADRSGCHRTESRGTEQLKSAGISVMRPHRESKSMPF